MARHRHSNERRLTAVTIQDFNVLRGQLQTFYDEVSILSKKNPDGKLNKFKLGFINGTLKKATVLLGEAYRPFADFLTFVDDELPSTSDVVMILSQYTNSMDRFKREHTHSGSAGFGLYWYTDADTDIPADGHDE